MIRIVPASTCLASAGAISPLNLLPGKATIRYWTGPISSLITILLCLGVQPTTAPPAAREHIPRLPVGAEARFASPQAAVRWRPP